MDCDIAGYHVESFNYFAEEGLQAAALDIPPIKFRLPSGEAVEFWYKSARLGKPLLDNLKPSGELGNDKLFPAECRQRGLSYRAKLIVNIDLQVDGRKIDSLEMILAEIPIMLRSKNCNLHEMDRNDLVKHGEEALERGGYFIINGSEKIMRLLVANKRNFPLAIRRKAFRDKGKLYSDCGIMMRCFRGNHHCSLITMHYIECCSMTLAIQYRRELFYIPLMYILKCLVDWNDAQIYAQLISGRPNDQFWNKCVRNMLIMAQDEGIISQKAALLTLGRRFRVALGDRIAPWEDDEIACRFLLNQCLAVHLKTDEQKFYCLAMMAEKLVGLVKNELRDESLDNPQFQEASVSGHIFLLICRERMENLLQISRRKLEIVAKRRPEMRFTSREFQRAMGSPKNNELTRGLEYFLSTGNLVTRTGVGLMQETGFAIIAERINQLRFVSHFRAIHRGAFFTEMRTTDVRKLRPEAWGFICPVHTPDGTPCGLLNHVTASATIVTHFAPNFNKLIEALFSLGVFPHSTIKIVSQENLYPVIVDGEFIGFVQEMRAAFVERQLRAMKVSEVDERVHYQTEITLIRQSINPQSIQTQYPGLYIYTVPGRMMRPVKNLLFNGKIEYIGIFEQVYLSIIIDPEEAELGVTMHQEIHPSSLFSFAGNLIPFPDHNQSPRNVYQCQMGKQTMGVPIHAWPNRADTKMYLLQTPQKPLLKLEAHDKYEMDEYPLGTNACVAVISYTGYDMEDAMVINRASYQRGFAHGTVVKMERVNLADRISGGGQFGRREECEEVFCGEPNDTRPKSVDSDGLPIQGLLYQNGDYYLSTFHTITAQFRKIKFKSTEPAYCGFVRIMREDNYPNKKVHILIQWRIQRNPIIGDKFASRHGQKGINSFLWPPESMPFSESGMVPDIIFNPHGFPSRMTIGMMIESMAGKSAAMHGSTYDASPFVFNEKNTAIDHFGKLLAKAGYNYYGEETMYSGVDGREMQVQVFFGIVYYQRLRHMISDKFQVRSTGPIDPVTLQPIKGRKRGGGIRFGEMERDALIAHGSAFCLQDRLFNCSDKEEVQMCGRCRSLVSVSQLKPQISTIKYRMDEGIQTQKYLRTHCTICKKEDQVFQVEVPRVFRYLCAELGAVNVKLHLSLAHPKDIKR